MARRPKGKKKGKDKGVPSRLFNAKQSSSIEEMNKEFKASQSGPQLIVKADETYTVAILADPTDWYKMPEHAIDAGSNNGFAYIPCPGRNKCPVCKKIPNNEARMHSWIPLYVYDNKRVQYFRAPPGAAGELTGKYERNPKQFLRRKWFLVRDDNQGATRYEFDRDDEPVSKKIAALEPPEINEFLERRFHTGIEKMGWKFTGESFDNDDDYDDDGDPPWDDEDGDFDLDDIKTMNKKELKGVIKEYKLQVDDVDDFKPKALRKVVRNLMKEQQEED